MTSARRAGRAVAAFFVGMTSVVALTVSSAPVAAQAAPADVPGAGAARPRLLYEPGAESDLQARLGREPYRTLFLRTHAQADGWDDTALGDQSVNGQRNLLRVAKVRAFEYALDRTVAGGAIVPFASPAARQAAGDQARDVLLTMLDRSRLAIPPPLGGWDRDISTSEEIVMAAQAYDLLLGAGYPLSTTDDAEIVRRIASVTRELRLNFVDPSTASNYTNLHQNNHRTKSGAAMAIAAVALADLVPDAREWFDTGADLVDDTLRYVLLSGDGAYSEGAFYYRYTTQNLYPYMAAWSRHLGAGSWTTAGGLTLPSLVDHPLLARAQRWLLDTSVPDGTMAPIDDGNPGRSAFYGVAPEELGSTAEGYWQWARTPQPYDIDGNVTLGPDAIVAYDDTVGPAEPGWEPTQVYVEGGTASLRSGWGAGATMALVLGEHDTASEFGRDRNGVGRWPQSHEHADPGAFLFHAYGERLALDPGYLTFATHGKVNQPEHHNTVLVDGQGPADYLAASIAWGEAPTARPPAEGQSTLHGTVVSDVADAVSVVSDYRDARLDRRVVMGGDRYLVVADAVAAPDAGELTWMLHGNGGGTSGGTYEATATGGRWTIGGARLDSGIAVSGGVTGRAEVEAVHEVPYTQERTHTALAVTGEPTAGSAAAVQVLYPTPSSGTPATIEPVEGDGQVGLVVTDVDAGRVVTVLQRDVDGGALAAGATETDGHLLVLEETTGGDLVSVWAEGATRITRDGTDLLRSAAAGALGLTVEGDRLHVVADTGAATVDVGTGAGAGTGPVAGVDGACGVTTTSTGTRVVLGASRTATLLATAAPATPAADAGRDRRVDVGTSVGLDGTRSCDADGSTLTPHWELVSAPSGSGWRLDGADGWRPVLQADRTGPYRARLTVTDATGRVSRQDEVVVIAGARCGDGVDDDLDGLIDTDDDDCDAGALDAAERWLTSVYRDLLGREPDAAGLDFWSAELARHGSRARVLAQLRRTPELARRMVRIAYDAHLGRPASASDQTFWSQWLRAGRSLDALTVELLRSAEAQRRAGAGVEAHVTYVLGALTGASPTPEAVAAGAAAVRASGVTAWVRSTLRTPAVSDARVAGIYDGLLRRPPEASGLAYWSGRLQAGGDVLDIVVAVAGTAEYAARTPTARPSSTAVRRALAA